MFPLKRRRKFARIYNSDLKAKLFFHHNSFDVVLQDISASGCNILFDGIDLDIKLNDSVLIDFTLNGKHFSLKAVKVREAGFNFVFDDSDSQAVLNNEVLLEYFKDTPELIPSQKQ